MFNLLPLSTPRPVTKVLILKRLIMYLTCIGLENTLQPEWLTLKQKKVNLKDVVQRNLIGEELLADKNNFPECKKNDFFYSDLEKCNVFDLNNKLIGKISGIFNFGAGDILEIKINEDNSTMLMNFDKYNFPKISIKKKSITLNIT